MNTLLDPFFRIKNPQFGERNRRDAAQHTFPELLMGSCSSPFWWLWTALAGWRLERNVYGRRYTGCLQ